MRNYGTSGMVMRRDAMVFYAQYVKERDTTKCTVALAQIAISESLRDGQSGCNKL